MSTNMSWKKSRSWTAVKASSGLLESARWVLAWGVVMMGRSRRREASTLSSKWSLGWGVSELGRVIRASGREVGGLRIAERRGRVGEALNEGRGG